MNTTSNKNSQIKTKLNNWFDGVERLNNASNNSPHHTAQNSLDNFKITITTMVENAPQFAKEVDSASSEYREILLKVGQFINEIIGKLTNNMKDVEVIMTKKHYLCENSNEFIYVLRFQSKLQNTKKTVQENEWLIKATNAQHSIEDAVTKIKSYGASDERIKSVIDNAFVDFVKFVNTGITPTLEKVVFLYLILIIIIFFILYTIINLLNVFCKTFYF